MEIIKAHVPSLSIFLTLFLISVAKTCSSIQPSEFVNRFLGAKKGDKIEGLDHVRQYLIKYGYMNSVVSGSNNREHFDSILAEAVKKYQLYSHLDPSGVLDETTLAEMALPRCGVPDLVNGNPIPRGTKLVLNVSDGSYYTFEPTKWNKRSLTWAIRYGTRVDAFTPIGISIARWEINSKLHFFRSSTFEAADLTMSFFRREHGDGIPFDGPGGVLAHSMFPPSGKLHFDADEYWVNGAVAGGYDIGTIALHEIGHLLGLGHSNVQSAIMWRSINAGQVKELDPDDIAGINALYP